MALRLLLTDSTVSLDMTPWQLIHNNLWPFVLH
jgi:hypothetical protein